MPPDPPGFFPPAASIPPLSPPHKQTMILLHGRGLSWRTFGPDLISTSFPFPSSPSSPPPPNTSSSSPSEQEQAQTQTLQTLHPHTKFLLPLAPRHRATIYARSIVRQWFDGCHLPAGDAPTAYLAAKEEWRCAPGLRDTVAHVHELIRAEAALVPGGARGVVLGGLSQGCAAGLAALLLWEGEPLAGFVGMCGWLVFEGAVRGVLEEDGVGSSGEGRGEEEGFDPFERDGEEEDGDGDGEVVGDGVKMVRVLREMMELDGDGPTCRPRSFDTPVFLGHGMEDDKVPVARGRGAAECLTAAGLDVEWKVYPELGHWYSAAMLTDLASFLTRRTGWDLDNKPS